MAIQKVKLGGDMFRKIVPFIATVSLALSLSSQAFATEASSETTTASNLTSAAIAKKISPKNRIVQLSVSDGFDRTACAVMANGLVKCWGSNKFGQLGYGSQADGGLKPDSSKPQTVRGVENAVYVDTKSKLSCAVTDTGDVYCWGRNSRYLYHRIPATPTLDVYSTATKIPGVSNATTVTISENRVCANTSSGVICWGGANDRGDKPAITPFGVPGFELGKQIVLANDGLLKPGALYGMTSSGEVIVKASRTGWNDSRPEVPTPIANVSGVRSFSANNGGLCYVDNSSAVYCFNNFVSVGANDSGRLGVGVNQAVTTPTKVVGLGPSRVVSIGSESSCAINDEGSLFCWGSKNANGSFRSLATAKQVKSVPKMQDVSMGHRWGCALSVSGEAYCFGDNSSGNVGVNPTTKTVVKPKKIKF